MGETVTDFSQRLLAHPGGPGDAKAVRVNVALELGWRLAALYSDGRPEVGASRDVG